THTVGPSVMTRAGLHPAPTVDTTALAGRVSAVATLITLSVPADGMGRTERWKLVAYSHLPSGETATPTGCTSSGTKPTKSDGPNPLVSALLRLNTARWVVCCRVTNTNRPSGETATLTAPSPRGASSRPITAWG